MKRVWILLLCLACAASAVAQNEGTAPKVKVSVRAGGVGSLYLAPKGQSISLNPSKDYAERSMKIGATAGISVKIPLKPKLFLQTGLMYSLQRNGEHGFASFAQSDTDYSIDATIKYKTHHLRLPVMLMYRSSDAPNHLCVGAGVFADLAMGGKVIYSSSMRLNPGDSYLFDGNFNPFEDGNKYLYYHKVGDDYSEKYTLGNGAYFKRFNFGVAAEIGYQISKFYLGAHLDFGLLNMARPELCGENYKQRPLDVQVIIGYNIN